MSQKMGDVQGEDGIPLPRGPGGKDTGVQMSWEKEDCTAAGSL